MNADRPLFTLLFVPLLLAGASGCVDATRGSGRARVAKTTSAKSKAPGAVDPTAEIARLMSREAGPFPKHRLQLFGGLATGEYEAAAMAKPECTAVDADGDSTCELTLGTGPDSDGEPTDIRCLVDTVPRGPFGGTIAHRLNGAGLVEMPKLSVVKAGDGVTVAFVANWMHTAEGRNTVGTLKVATLYSQGYSATCSDVQPGGRKTFERVVGELFKSLTFSTNPRRPAFMSTAYDLRQGDRSIGFRYGLVEKRLAKPGSAEVDFSFRLETDGKTWRTADSTLLVARDPAGNVELYRQALTGGNGETLAVLSAKPSEDRKFRLKAERGAKSDALESTPKAPLSTELWSAGEFAKVARGARPSYRYAILGLDESGEPAFRYLSITRSAADVLLEEEEGDKKSDGALDAALKDELHVLPDGSVTKEVSTTSVSQRLFAWGKLPMDSTADPKAAFANTRGARAKGKGKAR